MDRAGIGPVGVSCGMDGFSFRAATADDAEFLMDMLVETVNWSPERRMSRAEVLADEVLPRYVSGWMRSGDGGVVAESDGQAVGAAWFRFFDEMQPGYAFIQSDIPELGIAVVEGWRFQGLGRRLLRELHIQARERGISQLCLGVERANHARELYLSEGYEVVESSDDADAMLKQL